MEKIERASSLPQRFEQVIRLLDDFKGYLNPCDYVDLLNLIEPVRAICIKCETPTKSVESVSRK